jgi:hypothetical protein
MSITCVPMSLLEGEVGGREGESGVEFSGSQSESNPNICCCVKNLGPMSLVVVSVSGSDSCYDIESCVRGYLDSDSKTIP